jgi:predicted PurR-regulated permease PerM
LTGFGLILAAILALILPLLENQIGALIDAIPGYVDQFRNSVLPWAQDWLQRLAPDQADQLQAAATQSVGQAAGIAGNIVRSVINGGVRLIDIITVVIVTPVVAFLMLKDWPAITKTVDSLLPRRYYDVIREQLGEIDETLSGFIRGQALVCLALGTLYTIGLSLVGLKYGAAIGVTAGALSFIPFVGTGFGWVTSLLLAFSQFGDLLHMALVVGVFVIGHFLEVYVLTPRLVGHRVGLHPLWILFALITGAKLMGFTGVLIAVPLAAVIGVVTRFFLRQYKSSALYKDTL